ncbi:MAG: putative Na+/H+ antiporter, partial [bacterium]
IAAMLLADKVFAHKPSLLFSYATIGLLFVNISVGGVLTNFAAPPVLMVVAKWHWSTPFVFSHFGVKAIIGIVLSSLAYFIFFAKQLSQLNKNAKNEIASASHKDSMPLWVVAIHILFLVWVVLNSHHTVFVVWGFLAFLCVAQILKEYQSHIALKESLLVGCFLAGLVTHGGLQEWWIEAVLSRLSDITLFLGSVVLTAFNDNASLTYLASLVPEFMDNFRLQSAVVGGAIVGGGLTVIANAPNPAGQALLAKFFPNGIVKPLPLFFGALFPTILLVIIFRCVTC